MQLSGDEDILSTVRKNQLNWIGLVILAKWILKEK
jgi:hypothetical protein